MSNSLMPSVNLVSNKATYPSRRALMYFSNKGSELKPTCFQQGDLSQSAGADGNVRSLRSTARASFQQGDLSQSAGVMKMVNPKLLQYGFQQGDLSQSAGVIDL